MHPVEANLLLDKALSLIKENGNCKNLLVDLNSDNDGWAKEFIREMKEKGIEPLSEDFNKELTYRMTLYSVLIIEIMQKLIEDKLIRKNEQAVLNKEYVLTLKGMAFKGYQETLQEEMYEVTRLREHDRQIRLLTYVMAFGALATAMYYLFEFLKWYFGY